MAKKIISISRLPHALLSILPKNGFRSDLETLILKARIAVESWKIRFLKKEEELTEQQKKLLADFNEILEGISDSSPARSANQPQRKPGELFQEMLELNLAIGTLKQAIKGATGKGKPISRKELLLALRRVIKIQAYTPSSSKILEEHLGRLEEIEKV